MAVDYGDDIGEMLARAVGRSAGKVMAHHMEQYFKDAVKDFYKAKYEADGLTSESADTEAKKMASREQICLPFGTKDDAAYFTQVCRDNGLAMLALSDKTNNGYIYFVKDDLEKVKDCVPQFSDVITELKNHEIFERLAHAHPITEEQLSELEEVESLSDPSNAFQQEPGDRDSGDIGLDGSTYTEGSPNHTERIRNEVLSARDRCLDLADFERILNEKGIGVGTTKDGEMLFYEARIGKDGKLLPYDHDMRDWAVGAKKLKANFSVDATHDWFEERFNQEQADAVDGSLDMDGSTPDINQGIESHDGMDTDNRTLRLEREQNGTDVSPSKVREEADHPHDDGRGYDLNSTAKECRKASTQLSKSKDAPDRDLSDKFQQER
ncbi:hypothetical protein GIR35_12460 [Enterococcus faecalis]|nr:hypothetical protein GIR35_12460 [Enterococcus faecalis]